LNGIKEATVEVAGMEIKVAVANGTGNAAKLLDKVRSGEASYHFIEVMGCEGGCINGGGQPIINDKSATNEVKAARIKGLYDIDLSCEKRKSHDNPEIQKLYSEYLGEAGGHKAHKLLHTHYVAR
jgi:NADH-quinone oxidoreductase subunit G/NADP-reducing hydrogenase subunit HndD